MAQEGGAYGVVSGGGRDRERGVAHVPRLVTIYRTQTLLEQKKEVCHDIIAALPRRTLYCLSARHTVLYTSIIIMYLLK